MSIERDKDFEQLEDIAAMMTENTGIEFENGKYVYYGLDGRTAFAAVYISGAWAGWQAKANAVPEGQILVNKGDYVELVRTNRERQKVVARLTEEVKILRDRKRYYKNKCKALEFGDD